MLVEGIWRDLIIPAAMVGMYLIARLVAKKTNPKDVNNQTAVILIIGVPIFLMVGAGIAALVGW